MASVQTQSAASFKSSLTNTTPSAMKSETNQKVTKKKICCACPESKKARDECIVINGEEACQSFIEAHKVCLRSEGFNV